MKIVVLKFGGTSVGSIDRIKNVAKIIKEYFYKQILFPCPNVLKKQH